MNRSLRVVVADDEPDLLRYYGRVLVGRGHQPVALVGCGNDLVCANEIHNPDLVITDINMPGLSGWEAIVRMTNEPLLIIASASDNLELHGSSGDLVAYLRKPFKRHQLEAALEKAEQQSLRRSFSPTPVGVNLQGVPASRDWRT